MKKLDNIPVRIPGGAGFPPQDVFVNFREVESSNVRMVGWDDAGNLYVRFKSGATYVYLGVSRQRAVALAYAKSVGQYLNRVIKSAYDVIQIGAF